AAFAVVINKDTSSPAPSYFIYAGGLTTCYYDYCSLGCTISDLVEPLPLTKGQVLSERECQAQACAPQSLLNAANNLGNIRVVEARNQKVNDPTFAFPDPFGRFTMNVPALFEDLLDARPGSRSNIRSPIEYA